MTRVRSAPPTPAAVRHWLWPTFPAFSTQQGSGCAPLLLPDRVVGAVQDRCSEQQLGDTAHHVQQKCRERAGQHLPAAQACLGKKTAAIILLAHQRLERVLHPQRRPFCQMAHTSPTMPLECRKTRVAAVAGYAASLHIPGGTKGTEPVAMMMSLAVTSPPTSTRPVMPYLTVWGPTNRALPVRISCTGGVKRP